MNTQAVVIPIYESYLSVLLTRANDFTTLIWGWHDNAKRFASPERIFKQQAFVPFLYRPIDQDPYVTQVALCGLLMHKDDRCYPSRAAWVEDHRVEKFANSNWNSDVVAYCVVSSGHVISPSIAFQDLHLVSKDRPLDPNKNRGYALVHLPQSLYEWYEAATTSWTQLEKLIPKCTA